MSNGLLRSLASRIGFDAATAGRKQLRARVRALEDLYGAHPAQRALEDLHQYLFPERYAAVPTYEWHAGTIEEVARRIERALPDAPDAHTSTGSTTRK